MDQSPILVKPAPIREFTQYLDLLTTDF